MIDFVEEMAIAGGSHQQDSFKQQSRPTDDAEINTEG